MQTTPTVEARAEHAAELIEGAYLAYDADFHEITRRSRRRFEGRDWQGAQHDAVERLRLYGRAVGTAVGAVAAVAGGDAGDATGERIRAAYERRIRGRDDAELAETFYNSVIRRVVGTVGVNPRIEYVDAEPCRPAAVGVERRRPIHRCYDEPDADTAALVERILRDTPFDAPFATLADDARRVAERIGACLRREWGTESFDAIEMLPAVFYRNKGGYRVGRIRRGDALLPLLLPMIHTEDGVVVDAVLLGADEASVVFGFTRSYFHVELERPRAAIDFLRSIMPLKRVDELYTAIGHNKHGKRELYRSLCCQLQSEEARFEPAEGERGMVMSVFTLPSLNVVFKVIRDRFAFPKDTTRERVKEKYDLVFVRDRVGRLADAQEFEHLEFDRRHFAPQVLDELLAEAGETVRVEGGKVVIEHLYTERRVTPLNLYLKRADEAEVHEVLADYGYAIKDLAAADIFPGDMLLKNFGVTRHGRVIFYDYDELCLLGECNFRRMPEPRDDHDEMSAEPHFHVRENDIFPEEFLTFLVPRGPLRERFAEIHGDLFDVPFWRGMQQRQQGGEVVDFFPYRRTSRLSRSAAAGGGR